MLNNRLMRSGPCQYVVLEAEQLLEESQACDEQRPISWACPMSSAGNSVEFTERSSKGVHVDCTSRDMQIDFIPRIG
jgi:hypothetical protein